MITIKDLYTFGDMIYFAIETDIKTLYYKANRTDGIEIPHFRKKYEYENWHTEFNLNVEIQNRLISLSRGDYYNEIKKGITEYCNYEVMQRLKEVENE